MKKQLLLSVTLLTLSFNSFSADIAAGKNLAARCSACHGVAGISANPQWPNLAGQKNIYLMDQIKAFRDGKRESALMAPMAQGLSDEDIENIAAYFSSL